MSDKKPTSSTKQFATDSAPIPEMQLAPGNVQNPSSSADIPTLEIAPGSPPETKPETTNENKK